MFVHADNGFLGFSVVIEHSEANTCWEDVFGGCQRARALVLTTWGQQVTVVPVSRESNGFCTGQRWPHQDRNTVSLKPVLFFLDLCSWIPRQGDSFCPGGQRAHTHRRVFGQWMRMRKNSFGTLGATRPGL